MPQTTISCNFRIEIDGTTVASFSEVSGITADVDAVDYREGEDPMKGLRRYGVITLKRGYTNNSALWDWLLAAATGGANARRSGCIVLRNEAQTDVLYFHFTNGFLNKIEGPHLAASGNEIAFESVEISHKGLRITVAE
jgi:phage tail-like protein